ncbi:MAG TPA: hypothetical protein VGF44_03840 [Terriglobales bacterium]|jgi:hypothetical protein
MTWKHKTGIRILLLVAEMMLEDSEIKKEIRSLATHISYGAGGADKVQG